MALQTLRFRGPTISDAELQDQVDPSATAAYIAGSAIVDVTVDDADPGAVQQLIDTMTRNGFVVDVGVLRYSGSGTMSELSPQAAPFTANPTVTEYDLTAAALAVTLNSTDPDGTTYVFWDGTGTASSMPHIFTPNGGLMINGVSFFSFDRDWGSQVVKKVSGNWRAGQ